MIHILGKDFVGSDKWKLILFNDETMVIATVFVTESKESQDARKI